MAAWCEGVCGSEGGNDGRLMMAAALAARLCVGSVDVTLYAPAAVRGIGEVVNLSMPASGSPAMEVTVRTAKVQRQRTVQSARQGMLQCRWPRSGG